jgi:O-antigen ligase
MYELDLGRMIGSPLTATHNLFLAILVSGGVISFIPFVIVLYSFFRDLYRRRTTDEAALSFVMLVVAIGASLSLNMELKKWFWIVLGAGCATSHDNLRPENINISGRTRNG